MKTNGDQTSFVFDKNKKVGFKDQKEFFCIKYKNDLKISLFL
jgi:hypothetical protein